MDIDHVAGICQKTLESDSTLWMLTIVYANTTDSVFACDVFFGPKAPAARPVTLIRLHVFAFEGRRTSKINASRTSPDHHGPPRARPRTTQSWGYLRCPGYSRVDPWWPAARCRRWPSLFVKWQHFRPFHHQATILGGSDISTSRSAYSSHRSRLKTSEIASRDLRKISIDDSHIARMPHVDSIEIAPRSSIWATGIFSNRWCNS